MWPSASFQLEFFRTNSQVSVSAHTPSVSQVKGGINMADTKKVVRDAGTGRFVPKKEAERRPRTTVTETIPAKKGGKK